MSLRERGPDPDAVPESETERLLIRIIAQAVREKDVQIGYQENSGGRFEKWILSGIGALVVSSVIGAIAVYGGFSTLQGKFDEWQKSVNLQLQMQSQRIDRLEQRRP